VIGFRQNFTSDKFLSAVNQSQGIDVRRWDGPSRKRIGKIKSEGSCEWEDMFLQRKAIPRLFGSAFSWKNRDFWDKLSLNLPEVAEVSPHLFRETKYL
jgi:hypothetical protein